MLDLSSLLSAGGWLADDDLDGLPDDTHVTIVLRDGISHDEVLAAAELAARIGHETIGLSPPIAVTEQQVALAHPHRVFLSLADSHRGGAQIGLRGDCDVEITAASPAQVAGALRFLARRFPESAGVQATAAILERIGGDARVVTFFLTPTASDVASARICAAPALLQTLSTQETEGVRIELVSPAGEALATVFAPCPEIRLCPPAPDGHIASRTPVAPTPLTGVDLARPYRQGGLLADANGGSTRADVRLTLASDASGDDLVALVSVAARLGLEAPALHLPLDGRSTIRFGPSTDASEIVVHSEKDNARETIDVRGPAAGTWLAFGAPGPPMDVSADLATTIEQERRHSDRRDSNTRRIVWSNRASLPWEADELRACLTEELLPQLSSKDPVSVTLTLSEPPHVREELRGLATAALRERGLDGTVTVRPAYKQGLHWLLEEVAPAAANLGAAASLRVGCRPFGRSATSSWESPMVLKELRLFDEQAAAELEQRLHQSDGAPAWLDPPARWLLELHPVDELLSRQGLPVRIELDVDQRHTYRAEVLDQAGVLIETHTFDPLWVEQPFLTRFPHVGLAHPSTGGIRLEQGDLVVERRIMTDPELIWEHLQDVVLPALAAELRARHADRWPDVEEPLFASLELDVAASEPDERISVDEERVSPLEALHEDLHFGPLEFLAAWGETERGTPFMSPGQVVPRIRYRPGRGAEIAARLTVSDGADATLQEGCEQLRVTRVRLGEQGTPVEIDVSGRDGKARTLPVVAASDGPSPAHAVPTDRSLSPEEVERLALGLSAHRDVDAFAAGETVLGRPLVAVSAVRRGGAAVFSTAKAVVWRPTLLINAGHHGNEPSSTNAVLRLIELLIDDEQSRMRLARSNVVVLPLENADGAALARELATEHPEWMLHAGRFNSLGFEFRAAYDDPGHPSIESRALPSLWRDWMPEVYIDAHGCPSHEWVQPFCGYVPVWPAYWAPRAQLMAYVRYPDGAEFVPHERLATRLVELVDQAAAARPEIVALNERFAGRYSRYATHWMPETFPLTRTASGSVIYVSTATPGSEDWTSWSTDFMSSHPEVTSVSMITEIPDETVSGVAMARCTDAQLATFDAALELLNEWDGELERYLTVTGDACERLIRRPRPLRRACDSRISRRNGNTEPVFTAPEVSP